MRKKKLPDVFFIILVAICITGLTINLFLYQSFTQMQKKLNAEKENIEKMQEQKRELLKIKKDSPGASPLLDEQKKTDIMEFFETRARKHELPVYRYTPEATRKIEGWRELRYTLSFQTRVEINKLLQFIADIEKERPYLKLQDIEASVSGMNFERLTITFVAYEREK